jgi:hypothetical protein
MTEHYPKFLQAAEQGRREEGARAAVIAHLCSLGVDESVADGAWIAVRFALGRYSDQVSAPRDAEHTKIRIEEIARAAASLVEAIEKAPDVAWDHLAAETTRIVHRSRFEADVRMVRDSATDALGRLKPNGRPAGAKAALVDKLAMIWRRATGETPGKSGDGTFDAPRSHFGRFVKVVVVSTIADPSDFRKGFAELIVSAAGRYKKRNPARVSKAIPKI